MPRQVFILILVSIFIPGCATSTQKHAESVAKDWCQTIRASQIIPIYPLSQDLVVGDTFLVQIPVSEQEKQYKKKGFMRLDDYRVRLPITNFSNVYFDGFLDNEFAKDTKSRSKLSKTQQTNTSQELNAPAVAFPSYSFKAKSGFGLSSAFPIHSIPVALGFLKTDQINGSVTISDATTYAGDRGTLLALLNEWATNPVNQDDLRRTAHLAAPTSVYLRVISRVYLAKGMTVSLSRSTALGARAAAGNSPPVGLVNPTGSVDSNYSNILQALNQAANQTTAVTKAGGASQFVSASDSTVGMEQKFERPLAVGYLGFDVPVYEDGRLGTAIPTFQVLNGGLSGWLAPALETHLDIEYLEQIVNRDPQRARNIMLQVVQELKSSEFIYVEDWLKSKSLSLESPEGVKKVFNKFDNATWRYLAIRHLFNRGTPQRLTQFNSAFEKALAETREDAFAETRPIQ